MLLANNFRRMLLANHFRRMLLVVEDSTTLGADILGAPLETDRNSPDALVGSPRGLCTQIAGTPQQAGFRRMLHSTTLGAGACTHFRRIFDGKQRPTKMVAYSTILGHRPVYLEPIHWDFVLI